MNIRELKLALFEAAVRLEGQEQEIAELTKDREDARKILKLITEVVTSKARLR